MTGTGETTIHKVRSIFTAEGLSTVQTRMRPAVALADRFHRSLGGVRQLLLSPLPVAGGAGLFGLLVRDLKNVGEETEAANLSMVRLLQQSSKVAGGAYTQFDKALGAAQALRKEAERLAEASPATKGNILDSVQTMTMFLSKARLTLREQAAFARDVAVADKGNVMAGTAARDVRQILSGSVAVSEISTQGLGDIAKEAAKLARSGKMREAVAMIQDNLKLDPKLLEAYKNSMVGLTSTARDKLLNLKREAAGPLMTFMTGKLKEINAWMSTGAAKDLARDIGEGVVSGLRTAESIARFMVDHWNAIKTTVMWMAGAYGLASLVKTMGVLVGGAKAFAGAMKAAAAATAAANLAGAAGGGALGKAGKAAAAGGFGGMLARGLMKMGPWGVLVGGALYGGKKSIDYLNDDSTLAGGRERVSRAALMAHRYATDTQQRAASTSDVLDQVFQGKELKANNVKMRGRKVEVRADNVDVSELFQILSQPLAAAIRANSAGGPPLGFGAGLALKGA